MTEQLGQRILIIDDDRSTRLTLSMALRYHGYRVDLAEDAKEGLARIDEADYDWIISDVRMPKINGRDLVNKLNGIYPRNRVILISAYEPFDNKDQMLNDIAAFIEKPVDINKIINIFNRPS